MEIKGKVVYQNIATGFWGIIDNNNGKWRVTNMPVSLQKEGLQVKVVAEKVEEGFSLFMWGKPIRITNYEV
ncbi:MAG: hypothetical protein MUE81_06345 [Thermoflexibacter sp.]|jgi:hypothetical protein|nr:hypothetical protein [Thermoflexibacter sp.]